MTDKTTLKKLNESFGSYRAEWLKDDIFKLFAEPSYFTALQDNRPCVLEGGRGTGKTTVLRGLSYQGQYELHQNNIIKCNESEFIGIYHRVNTNHSRAFADGDVDDSMWIKLFGHYFNLVICREILLYIKWHKNLCPEDEDLSPHVCQLIGRSLLCTETPKDFNELLQLVDIQLYDFQSRINTIADGDIPSLSMAGVPIEIITENVVILKQFIGKGFFIMLDEYENYSDYQQQLINTLIKHSTDNYTFKIGVRELGWRIKHTMNPEELLIDPADYVLFNIEQRLSNEAHFSEFAKLVCQQRINKRLDNITEDYNIEDSLGGITNEEEANILGVEKTNYWKEIERLPKNIRKKVNHLPNLYLFFIAYWAKWHGMTLEESINDYLLHTSSWNTRYENYKYGTLFKIRKGRGKGGIQKYYAGWNTYIKLANGNIRYLMELVYKAYEIHLNGNGQLSKVISYKDQTIAAQEVGLKNLNQLEGHWKNGAQLTKLLLGLGRVFQLLASTEGKIAPEKNQFSIENSESLSPKCKELIDAAVMNLALVRSPGNKLTDETHTKDYIYNIHPIYAAFFVFSHRKKRKLILPQHEILGLVTDAKDTIKSILLKSNVSEENVDGSLPTQMNLFEQFYND